MQTKRIKLESYNLIITKTKSFKEIDIKVVFKLPFNKDDITKDSLLVDMLSYSTKKYPTNMDLVNKSKDLYGAFVDAYNSRMGNFNLLNVTVSVIHGNYVQFNTLKEGILLLKEVLLNPNVDDGDFDIKTFNIAKERLKGILKNVKDNKSRYAELRMLESMDKTKPYAYNIDGNLKDLKKITSKDIYQEYLRVINDAEINIYVTGNVDYLEVVKLFKDNINFSRLNKKYKDVFINNNETSKIKMIVEKTDNIQSKLSIGCKIDNPKNEMLYSLFLYNIILGASTKSRLFLNVREKLSYAYYINSGLILTDNVLVINSGIDKINLMNVINEIKKEMEDLKKGNITDEEIESAKKTYISSSLMMLDNLTSITHTISSYDTLGKDNYSKRLNIIKNINKEDIIKVANSIHIDTVFLLEEGDQIEKN